MGGGAFVARLDRAVFVDGALKVDFHDAVGGVVKRSRVRPQLHRVQAANDGEDAADGHEQRHTQQPGERSEGLVSVLEYPLKQNIQFRVLF